MAWLRIVHCSSWKTAETAETITTAAKVLWERVELNLKLKELLSEEKCEILLNTAL